MKLKRKVKKLKAKVQRMHEEAAASEDRLDSLQMRVEKLEGDENNFPLPDVTGFNTVSSEPIFDDRA